MRASDQWNLLVSTVMGRRYPAAGNVRSSRSCSPESAHTRRRDRRRAGAVRARRADLLFLVKPSPSPSPGGGKGLSKKMQNPREPDRSSARSTVVSGVWEETGCILLQDELEFPASLARLLRRASRMTKSGERATPPDLGFRSICGARSRRSASLVKPGGGKRRSDAPPSLTPRHRPPCSHIQTTFPSSHFCKPISRL